LAQYPSIRFILDVHRDALISQDGAAYKLVAQEGEQKVAQVMFVVGSSDGSTDHPNWRENLGLAIHLQSSLTQRYDELARPITLRSSRFNQHLSTGSLLVEVGGHGNTLEEAVEGGKLFARTVGAALKDMK
jgi:stage II sporulation protein P